MNKNIKYAQSRLQKNILLLSAFLLLASLVWLDKTFHPYLKTYFQNQAIQDVNDWDKYNEKTFTVVNVVDGDTIDINIPDPPSLKLRRAGAKYDHTRIRLWGVDTPETKSTKVGIMYFGPEAAEFTKELCLGKQVTVYLDENDTRDKYNRLLAYIQLPDGKFLNEELLSEGFAYADTRFEHSKFEKYTQLEKKAQEQKKGLWEKVTPDQMPSWRQKINHE